MYPLDYWKTLRPRRDGAGDGIRTRDINLGKVALYQLSYSRLPVDPFSLAPDCGVKPPVGLVPCLQKTSSSGNYSQ